MKRLYFDANDKNIATYVVYGDTETDKLYTDAAKTVEASAAKVEDAFMKNLLTVVVGDDTFKPVKFSGGVITVIDYASSAVAVLEFATKA